MQYRQTGNLLKVVLFIKSENALDAVVLDDHAVDDISDARVIFQNALADVVEEFCEVVRFVATYLEELYFQAVQAFFAEQLSFNRGDFASGHIFGGCKDIYSFG